MVCLYTVKWLQVLLFNTNYSSQDYLFVCTFVKLLCISKNSIQRQSFIYTQLNDLTVIFLKIQSIISH